MAKIETMTVTVKTAAVIVATVVTTSFSIYFAFAKALEPYNTRLTNVEMNQQEIKTEISYIKEASVDFKNNLAQLTNAIITYREAIKPEETGYRRYKRL